MNKDHGLNYTMALACGVIDGPALERPAVRSVKQQINRELKAHGMYVQHLVMWGTSPFFGGPSTPSELREWRLRQRTFGRNQVVLASGKLMHVCREALKIAGVLIPDGNDAL